MDSTTIVVLCAIMVSSIYGSVMSMLNGLFLHFASAVQHQHTAVIEGDCAVVLPSLDGRECPTVAII